MIRRGQFKLNFEELWQEGMKDWHGNMPERMLDDSLEEKYWTESIARKTIGQTDPYASIIFEQIKTHIAPTDAVLEIGPGWGNYTFPLLKHAHQVTCVDSSESVLRYLQQCCEEKGHTNTEFIHEKWETYSDVAPHDVVLGVNCFYRMLEIKETLRNMNNGAKKLAIIGMTSGPIQPHYNILHEKFGYDIKFPRRDYIDLLNILYEMDIYANCQLIKLERMYRYDTYAQLVEAQSKKVLNTTFEREHVETALANFVELHDGQYCYRHDFHAALISWQPVTKI
jgi:hypothetical protein